MSCITFQYSTRQACCCLRGQGPIWASECPGSLMWQCTCLAFQSSHPKPRTRPRHQRARPALTHMQQQPGHLWSFGSPCSCVYMCVRIRPRVCVCAFCLQTVCETSRSSQHWLLLRLCLASEPLGAAPRVTSGGHVGSRGLWLRPGSLPGNHFYRIPHEKLTNPQHAHTHVLTHFFLSLSH